MVQVTPMDLEASEDELEGILQNAVKLYPVVEQAEKLFDYESLKTGETSYFVGNELREEKQKVLASYTVFPDLDSVMRFMRNGMKKLENPDADIDIMDENIVIFKIKDIDNILVGQTEFAGELKNLSEEEKNELVNQFLNSLDRKARLLDL